MTMTDVSVRNSVTVDAPIERAFDVFTAGIGSWWPPEHHLLEAEFADMIFEPRVGGHIIDRGVDGSECRWSRVLAYDPPHRVVFTWDINPQFQLEPDPAKASEVEVQFHAEGPGRTRVDLEHRHLDRHGDGWEGLRDALGTPDGWPHELEAFAAAARR
jgi:uncharacterized protein YndB with AHSA1/START domain